MWAVLPGVNAVVETPVQHGATPGIVAFSAAGPPDPASPPDWQPVVSNYARPQGATPKDLANVCSLH